MICLACYGPTNEEGYHQPPSKEAVEEAKAALRGEIQGMLDQATSCMAHGEPPPNVDDLDEDIDALVAVCK